MSEEDPYYVAAEAIVAALKNAAEYHLAPEMMCSILMELFPGDSIPVDRVKSGIWRGYCDWDL